MRRPVWGLYRVPVAGCKLVPFNVELSTQFIISSESEVAETNEWVLNPTGFAVITAPVPTFFPTFIVIEFDVASDIDPDYYEVFNMALK